MFINIDNSQEGFSIFIGSPFWGLPTFDKEGEVKVSTTKVLILDLHILECIRKLKNKENTVNLVKWALDNQVILIPHIALSEQFLSHGNPKRAFDNLIDSFKKNYNYEIPEYESSQMYKALLENAPVNRSNTEMMRDFIVITKYFYKKKDTLENKIADLCELIHKKNVPVFAFAVIVACLFFYVKEYPKEFHKKTVSKLESDMFISADQNKEERSLWNFASDIMLFMAAVDLFYNKESNDFNFSYIASSDKTVALILENVCLGELVIVNSVCQSKPAIRPGIISEKIDPLLKNNLKASSKKGSFQKVNLRNLALELSPY